MLDRLVAEAWERAATLARHRPRFEEAAAALPPAHDLGSALRVDGLSVIAEVKRRSPSAGEIAGGLDAASLASAYAAGGAAAVSVLTEPEHFGARADDLGEVRAAVDVPVLRKDFVVDPVQVWETRAMGADAVLLIVAALEQALLVSLLTEAGAAGLAALVEAHTEDEVGRAVDAGAGIVGVNNRDLRSLDVDLRTAERLRHLIPADRIAVAESGVDSPGAASRMAAAGYDAVLVGEAAVRSDDPSLFVAELLEVR